MYKFSRFAVSAALNTIIALIAFGCAGTPKVTNQVSKATVTIMDQSAIRQWGGYTFNENPYLAPEGLVRGKPFEFVVLKVDLTLIRPEMIEIQSRLVDSEGVAFAEPATLDDMKAFWEGWPVAEADALRRLDRLERSYSPGLASRATKGHTTWYLVYSLKNPIKRPSKVISRVFIGESLAHSFEYSLPELPGKK